MSGLWKAPDVAKREKRPLLAAHASSARVTAAGVPAMTIWPPPFRFAGTSTSSSAH